MIKYRVYQISFTILLFTYSSETGVFKIRNKLVHFLLSFWYTLITFILGFIGILFPFPYPFYRIGKTIDALSINIGGGLEIDKEMNELNYDEKTNYIWNNLLRTTTDKITKDELEIILEIQDSFEDFTSKYSGENVYYIIINLGKIDIHRIRQKEIMDIFDAIKLYDNSIIESSYD